MESALLQFLLKIQSWGTKDFFLFWKRPEEIAWKRQLEGSRGVCAGTLK